jgi:uncharacterized protein YbbC (DUF1343 family)
VSRTSRLNHTSSARFFLWLAITALVCFGAVNPSRGDFSAVSLQLIDSIVNREIQLGNVPGAVVLIGHEGKIVYRRAFGDRELEPQKIAMTEDTIFDLASLTKPIATATAIMQLVEQGEIDLDEPVTRYWAAFGANDKKDIRVRDLLKHSSGFRAGLNGNTSWSGYDGALRQVLVEKLVSPPGKNFLYSDINFIVLGELVARVSGLSLDQFCGRAIFTKLAMKDTRFKPSSDLPRIAPTTYLNGKLLQGQVHDPTAYRMRGVSGHAGLFSTADDLATFAQMMLNGGTMNGVQILKPQSVREMTTRQQAVNGSGWWGLGWEIAPLFNSDPNESVPENSFGHSGYTGTSIWIDPDSKTFVVILTNRVHPHGGGDVRSLRADVLRLIKGLLGPMSPDPAPRRSSPIKSAGPAVPVRSGIDQLRAQRFAPLAGLHVGLITNQTGIDSRSRRTFELLWHAPGVRLDALFSPEHGFKGDLDQKVSASIESKTKLPIYSLYGASLRPARATLRGLNALVFDIQDAGARFYTYSTTMAYAMEEAAREGLKFFVLDRPNPLTADIVQGPVMDADLKAFTGYFPMPVRHGMTIGELAAMFNQEAKIGAKLEIIKMAHYRRDAWYDQTGLTWVAPSPNLLTLNGATLYPGVAIVEGANLSVGRGTESPFELIGAPWIDGERLAGYLNQRRISGVSFIPASFTPSTDRYRGVLCHGVRIVLKNRDELDSPKLGLELASALNRLFGSQFQSDKTLRMIGARWVVEAIQTGTDPQVIVDRWQGPLNDFRQVRARYLLYP